VVGNDAAVRMGWARAEPSSSTCYIPMMARNLLESFKLLTNVSTVFAERCINRD